MTGAPAPTNEAERLAALHTLEILGAPTDERFARIVRLACRLFDAPMAVLSLVDAEQQRHLAAEGFPFAELPREEAFCAHTILDDKPFQVSDALLDERFADNVLVTGEPHVRFYAAEPFLGPDGDRLGALAVFDHRPRTLEDADLAALHDLATAAAGELRAMCESWALEQHRVGEAEARAIVDAVPDGLLTCDERGTVLSVNVGAELIFGYDTTEVIGENVQLLLPQIYRGDGAAPDAPDMPEEPRLVEMECESMGRRRSGITFAVRLHVAVLPNDWSGKRLLVVRDLTEGKERQSLRRNRGSFRSLRDLPDRAFFRSRYEQAMVQEARGGSGVAVLLLELDNFNRVIESLGRATADGLLMEAYRRLRASLRPDDTAAFLGGGAFGVLLENMQASRDAMRPADRILGRLRTSLRHGRSELNAAPNIGIALSTLCLAESGTVDLIWEADSALRQARASGRWRIHVLDAHEHPTASGMAVVNTAATMLAGMDQVVPAMVPVKTDSEQADPPRAALAS